MKKILSLVTILLLSMAVKAQEFNANVIIDYSKVQSSNNQVFDKMKKSISDFLNKTQWTSNTLAPQERIQAVFALVLESKSGSDEYKGTLTVQSARPVYGSTYVSPLLNFTDKDFTFKYSDFDNLVFNDKSFNGKNLSDILSYYAYLILGYDADSFAKLGGTPYFTKARQISDNAKNNNFAGWSSFDGPRNRGSLVEELLSAKASKFRDIYYLYHMQGLDKMSSNQNAGKDGVAKAILELNTYKESRTFYPIDLFVGAKREEISKIFSGGSPSGANLASIKNILKTIAPNSDSEYWSQMNK